MSVRVMAMVWEAQLRTTEKIVLLAIADSCNDDGDNAWPSVALLARKASVSERRIQQIVQSLCELGLLTVRPQAGGVRDMRHDRRPNLYAINLDGVKAISPRDANGVKEMTLRGEISSTNGVKPVSPYPSIDPSIDPSKRENDRFAEFWAAYPRREAKKAAQRAWALAIRSADPSAIIAGAARYASDPNREDAFTAHASTWLNQGRWEDEPLPSKAGKASGTRTFIQAANALGAMDALLELEAVNEPF